MDAAWTAVERHLEARARAGNNRTLTLSAAERQTYSAGLLRPAGPLLPADLVDQVVCGNVFDVADTLPTGWVDLLFLDPPYNLTKDFNGSVFRKRGSEPYAEWFAAWFERLLPVLKPTASVYVCADWRTSTLVHGVIERHLTIRNRITWEREKGRGALTNWKNCSEDIWFATVSDDYTFNVDAVRLRRRVVAPYREQDGTPRDWDDSAAGATRLTAPSNLWTDLTVPFWSMPENTDHPTQKPEKLLAKLLLASTRSGNVVFDPFLGSGTSAVVAQKLGRHFCGIEIDESYCCLARKRLALAASDATIQGYADGVFWDRNACPPQRGARSINGTFDFGEVSP